MNALFVGLATHIMKTAINCFSAEKTSRKPLWLPEVKPISDDWKHSFDDFNQHIAARRHRKALEQRARTLLRELESSSDAN